jgi:hypothetical protein
VEIVASIVQKPGIPVYYTFEDPSVITEGEVLKPIDSLSGVDSISD